MKLTTHTLMTGCTLALALAGASTGCGSKDDDKSGTFGGTDFVNHVGTGTGGAGLGGGQHVDAGPVFGSGGSGAGTGSTPGGGGAFQVCNGEDHGAEPMPVDMYIMFDQSSSMGEPIPGSGTRWWDAAVAAVQTFVANPQAQSRGVGVGIQFFPLGGVEPASCNVQQYTTPEVEVAPLPGNSGPVSAVIGAHQPATFTPTGPALQGALDHMKAIAKPGRAPVVVLVTDGFPTECQPRQIADIAQLAKTAMETEPKVRTFVVGFETGGGLDNLNEIAVAGGTGEAFLISGGDIGGQFVNKMLSISSTPLQCDFDLPTPNDPMETLDQNKVSVTYTPAAGDKLEVPRLNSLGDCRIPANQGQGWYYDAPPPGAQKVIMCPGTCEKFAAGVVSIKYGCEPRRGETM